LKQSEHIMLVFRSPSNYKSGCACTEYANALE